MEFLHLLVLVLALQAILIAFFFLFRQSGARYPNVLLSLFLIISAWLLISSVLFWTKQLFTPRYVHFYFTYYFPLSLFAPLFYFYLRKIVVGKSILLKRDFWHFIPFIYTTIATFPFLILSKSDKLGFIMSRQSRDVAYLLFKKYDLILAVFMIMYCSAIVFNFWKIYKGNRDLRIWTRAIILSFVGCVLSFTVYYGLYYLGILTQNQDYVVILFLSLFVLIISYFAFNYSTIFNGTPIENVLPFVKYKKTGLSKSYSKELSIKLQNLMQKDKPYLNSELRLDDLAELLGVSRHHTSQIINEYFSTNFFDYINAFRIGESIELMEIKRKEVTLSELGYLAGFNNTVSFNKAFKKNIGITPSKYRKLLLTAEQNLN